MKRFLTFFVLLAFVAVNCAGPGKVGWTKQESDFRQDRFEEDRKKCVEIIDQDLQPEAFGQALEECLAQKGYKYHQLELKPEGNKSTTAKTIILSALIITGTAAGIALLILAAALDGAGASLGH